MTHTFDHFVAIDWSGAVGPRQPGIAVAICSLNDDAPNLVRSGHVWSRTEVLDWLLNDLPANTLVGLDLGISLPFADRGAYFPGWPDSPGHARDLWAWIDGICAGDPNLGVSSFVDHLEAARYFRRHGNRTGELFGSGRGRLRLTEQLQQAQGLNPYSNFNLVGAAQVGKSSLTGMRMLHRLAGALPIWPVDALPSHGSAIVEIYTSLAAITAGLSKARTKMRTGAALDQALSALGSAPHVPLARYTDHATDALLTAAWLRTIGHEDQLWAPRDLETVAQTEGWTFGVR